MRRPPAPGSGSRTCAAPSRGSFATTAVQRCPARAYHQPYARQSSPPSRHGKRHRYCQGRKSAAVGVLEMRAIVARFTRPAGTGRKCRTSAPLHGEVVIEVSAAGVNRADLLQAAGNYPPPPGASEIIGLEVSGTIAEVGERCRSLAIGQHGVCFAGRRWLRRVRCRARGSGDAAAGRRRAAPCGRACPRWRARCGRTW